MGGLIFVSERKNDIPPEMTDKDINIICVAGNALADSELLSEILDGLTLK